MKPLSALRIHLPHEVYVLGSGPNGAEHHQRIPPDAFLISLNKAVIVRAPTVWMCWAQAYAKQVWALDALAKPFVKLIGQRLADVLKGEYSNAYRFEHYPLWTKLPALVFIPGVLRAGATIAGAALQFAYHYGAHRVILCGIDMFGTGYFDGTKGNLHREGRDWEDLNRLMEMIRLCQFEGLTVQSLSETRLDVERI